MTIAQKLTALNKKLASRKKMLEKNDERIAKDKARGKALHKEINEIAEEISQLEVKALSETLNTSGITAADVQNAIVAGIIKPSSTNEKDGATYSTTKAEKKEDMNEVSDS